MEFNLADLWELVVDSIPDHEAVVDGHRRFTYLELDRRANRLAHQLANLGVGPGDHIALYLHNCVEYLEAMIASFKLRAVPINVNYRYVADELLYLLDDADAVAIIYHPEFATQVEQVMPALPLLLHTIVVDSGYDAQLRHLDDGRGFAPRSGNDHYVLYTGGTTGMPKGIVWRHVDLFFAALGGAGNGRTPISSPTDISQRCMHGRIRVVTACPLMHGSAHWMAWSTLLTGGCVVLTDTRHFDAATVFALTVAEQANFIVIVGDAFAIPMVDVLRATDSPLTCLNVIVSGGAVLSPAVKHALIKELPQTIVVDGYGASETGGQGQAVTALGSPAEATMFLLDETTEVLDEMTLQVAEVGTSGLLARRGHIPVGYYKDADKTAATFRTVAGVRWSVPGDHAIRNENGTVTLLGRGSLCINTGGEKVYPDEVESQLKAHPSVFDAVVVGVAHARFGERVVALFQPRATSTIADLDTEMALCADILDSLRLHLAGYKIPKTLYRVDAIQRSPSGKPDYRWACETATRLASEASPPGAASRSSRAERAIDASEASPL